MANLQETGVWEEGIYQLETSDPVMGGADGVDNKPLRQLANRTGYLKKKLEEYKPEAASTTKAAILQLSSSTNSSSEELAASPKAGKAASDKAVESAGKGLPVGAVIGFPRAITSQEGYLKADGSTFNQSTYPDLYRVLGGNKLPNLTRSDVGMTAYFPVADIPDGWIKYDEIATRVTQAAYPDLYRKLVAQYGSIAAVPKAEDRFIRNAAGGLTGGTQQGDAIRNIKGKTSFCGDGNGTLGIGPKDPEGVFGGEGSPSAYTVDVDGSRQGYNYLTFDASRSVPVADEVRPKAIVMVLCIKAQNSLDDVVMWVKAFGKVTNAGTLDASKLAQDLQGKANKNEVAPLNHTHRAADITDLSQAVGALFVGQLTGTGYQKQPGGLIVQWLTIDKPIGSLTGNYNFPLAFPKACLHLQVSTRQKTFSGCGLITRAAIVSAAVFSLYEDVFSTTGSRTAALTHVLAIGH